jgi:hypothetical protein
VTALARLIGRGGPRILVLVDLVQDIDVLLPVLIALRDAGLNLRIVVSRWLEQESPRTAGLLQAHGLRFSYERRARIAEGKAPRLHGVAAVLSASDSSHPAHCAGHALAARAKAQGLRTYALQHGLENIGLLGVDAANGRFASETVFCWFPEALTPAELAADTRAKLDHVGRPSPPGGWTPSAPPRFDLAVYENLHWDRYGDADRTAFKAGLRAVAEACPDLRVLLRPHPAGGWADALRHEFAPFPGLTLLDAAETRRVLASTAQSPALAARVITTPSTVVLDAALAQRPVALAVGGGTIYTPIQVLEGPGDWLAFARSESSMAAALSEFRRRVLVEGEAADRIVQRMCRDIGVQPKVSQSRAR